MSDSNPSQRDRQFLEAAYTLDGRDDAQAMLDFYRQWADEYDQCMLDGLGYLSPSRLATLVQQHCPPQAEQTVIDLGCGTGLTGVALSSLGYGTIDGVDLSEAMLEQAGKTAVYRQLQALDLTADLPIASATYDIAVCSGTFTHGHVDAQPLTEIVRILRVGGLFAFTVHKDLWQSAGFELRLSQLTSSQVLHNICRHPGAYFKGESDDGWFCVYRKTAHEVAPL